MSEIMKIKEEFVADILTVESLGQLKDVQVKYLGKKGLVTSLLKEIRNIEPEHKKEFGNNVNQLQQQIGEIIGEKEFSLKKIELSNRLFSEKIDVTLPGVSNTYACIHPLTKTTDEICEFFMNMGYDIAVGPEIESDLYNFEMLNIPKNHSARDMQDTFYFSEDLLLRTHTSPVQVRSMLASGGNNPIRVICPGKVYRRDEDDATHSHQFMQIEGLLLDENISIANLKGTLTELVKYVFGDERKIRLRPSYFPFTEPSMEVDIDCFNCHGEGCNICKKTGWIEVLGAGMVHPNVLEMCGYDSNKYSGFAFGLGVERFAMLKYGIRDIRDFYTNDIRFLQQFVGDKEVV